MPRAHRTRRAERAAELTGARPHRTAGLSPPFRRTAGCRTSALERVNPAHRENRSGEPAEDVAGSGRRTLPGGTCRLPGVLPNGRVRPARRRGGPRRGGHGRIPGAPAVSVLRFRALRACGRSVRAARETGRPAWHDAGPFAAPRRRTASASVTRTCPSLPQPYLLRIVRLAANLVACVRQTPRAASRRTRDVAAGKPVGAPPGIRPRVVPCPRRPMSSATSGRHRTVPRPPTKPTNRSRYAGGCPGSGPGALPRRRRPWTTSSPSSPPPSWPSPSPA